MPGFKNYIMLGGSLSGLSGRAYKWKKVSSKKPSKSEIVGERRGRPVCIILNTSVCPLCYSVPEKPFLLLWKNSSDLKDYSDQIDCMETNLNI